MFALRGLFVWLVGTRFLLSEFVPGWLQKERKERETVEALDLKKEEKDKEEEEEEKKKEKEEEKEKDEEEADDQSSDDEVDEPEPPSLEWAQWKLAQIASSGLKVCLQSMARHAFVQCYGRLWEH